MPKPERQLTATTPSIFMHERGSWYDGAIATTRTLIKICNQQQLQNPASKILTNVTWSSGSQSAPP